MKNILNIVCVVGGAIGTVLGVIGEVAFPTEKHNADKIRSLERRVKNLESQNNQSRR